jgi:hypothetical protein
MLSTPSAGWPNPLRHRLVPQRRSQAPHSSRVAAEQMTADTWRIRAQGNNLTSNVEIQDFILLNAAETTEAAAATHFQIIGSTSSSAPNAP